MAREGLRTLVVAKKVLTEDQYEDFEVSAYKYLKPLYDKIQQVWILTSAWASLFRSGQRSSIWLSGGTLRALI